MWTSVPRAKTASGGLGDLGGRSNPTHPQDTPHVPQSPLCVIADPIKCIMCPQKAHHQTKKKCPVFKCDFPELTTGIFKFNKKPDTFLGPCDILCSLRVSVELAFAFQIATSLVEIVINLQSAAQKTCD